ESSRRGVLKVRGVKRRTLGLQDLEPVARDRRARQWGELAARGDLTHTNAWRGHTDQVDSIRSDQPLNRRQRAEGRSRVAICPRAFVPDDPDDRGRLGRRPTRLDAEAVTHARTDLVGQSLRQEDAANAEFVTKGRTAVGERKWIKAALHRNVEAGELNARLAKVAVDIDDR